MGMLTDLLRMMRTAAGFGSEARPLPELELNNRLCQALDQNRMLADYTYTVFDTELTGMSPRRDEIVSIGAVRIRGLSIVPGESFSALVRPSISLPKTSTLIHRITPEAISQAPSLHEVLPAFIEFCSGSLLVGHHVSLDMEFVHRATRRLYGGPLGNPCLDTLRLTSVWRERRSQAEHERCRQNPSCVLTDVTEEFALPHFTAHNALGDAMQTAYLFLYLVGKIARNAPMTLRGLYQTGQTRRWHM